MRIATVLPVRRKGREAEKDRIPQLDGLRGIAVMMVFAYHTLGVNQEPSGHLTHLVYGVATLGISGVDLFFVLSGFLITRILLANRDASNFYSTFYARRALRIFPLYYGALILVFLVLPVIAKTHPYWGMGIKPTRWSDQLWFWFNLSNFRTAFQPMLVPPLSHFWTLAIEEQFYFVWPTIVRRYSEDTLKWICLIGSILPLLLRECRWIPTFGAIEFFHRVTVFHMEGLFLGAGLALLERSRFSPAHVKRALFACSLIGLSGVFLFVHYGGKPLSVALPTAFSLLYFGLVGLCAFPGSGMLDRIFSVAPLRSVGRYSYFIYVFHIMVLAYLWYPWVHLNLLPYWAAVLAALIVFFVAYGLGALSWRWIERPISGLNRHFVYCKVIAPRFTAGPLPRLVVRSKETNKV